MKLRRKIKKSRHFKALPSAINFSSPTLLASVTAVALGGIYILMRILAASLVAFEAESMSGGQVYYDSSASGGAYIVFGEVTTTPPPPPPNNPPPPPPVQPPPPPPPNSGNPGSFSGRITTDGSPTAGVLVKVVNIYHPNWVSDMIHAVLNGPDCGGWGAPDCYYMNTDSSGTWSAEVNPGTQYMLKIFHPSTCAANAITPAAYTTSDSGFYSANDYPFHSTPSAPANDIYALFYNGRYLFDMPVHVFPSLPQFALNGSSSYNDLNIDYYTRSGSFQTSNGTQSCN